jgi:hypothetical protein
MFQLSPSPARRIHLWHGHGGELLGRVLRVRRDLGRYLELLRLLRGQRRRRGLRMWDGLHLSKCDWLVLTHTLSYAAAVAPLAVLLGLAQTSTG